ncbi:MAG: helix-turn-helix domain-containing protein [Candidatus Margulisbacteria bacterium]|jgi:transcriptional regulator with XRE-family HTH domain|nr:helix-turn-helix domain-containing protein [Candidatus Margulisiibacteriota bacterium]
MSNNQLIEQKLKDLISRKLRFLRQKYKTTLEKTADFLDLDYAQYYKLLHGAQLPHLVTLMKINQAYGLNMDWWFRDYEEAYPVRPISKADIDQKADELEIVNNFNKLDVRSRKTLQKILKSMLKKRQGGRPVNNVYFFQQA